MKITYGDWGFGRRKIISTQKKNQFMRLWVVGGDEKLEVVTRSQKKKNLHTGHQFIEVSWKSETRIYYLSNFEPTPTHNTWLYNSI